MKSSTSWNFVFARAGHRDKVGANRRDEILIAKSARKFRLDGSLAVPCAFYG